MKNRTGLCAIPLCLALAACVSAPPGPVQPTVGPKAPGVLVIVPALQPYLDVPDGIQNYSFSAQNLLEYNTVVRNKGAKAMNLQYTVYFHDEKGGLVEEKSPQTFFIDSNSEVPLRISANSKEAKTMRVQIQPAK